MDKTRTASKRHVRRSSSPDRKINLNRFSVSLTRSKIALHNYYVLFDICHSDFQQKLTAVKSPRIVNAKRSYSPLISKIVPIYCVSIRKEKQRRGIGGRAYV